MNDAKLKIHFVLEGNEEYALFQLIEKAMKSTYIEMTYRNCHGGGTIPAFFQADLASDNYDIIYCVYDVDFKQNDENGMYGRIRKGLYKVLGEESEIDKISLCTNPNTLLVLLLGYTDLSNLKDIKADKKSNTELIHKYCSKIGNKKSYDASEWQLELIKNDYLFSNSASFDKMFESCKLINEKYNEDGIGSNILRVIQALIMDDVEYFKKRMEE